MWDDTFINVGGAINMNVKTIGIDLAKAIFQIHGVNEHGKCLFNKQLKRAQMISFLPICHPVWLAWKPVAALTIGPKNCKG